MRWITRRNLHIDRTACPWLIRKYIDPAAEFMFVAANADLASFEGRSFDMKGADYSHSDDRCTFEVMLERHELGADPALVEMGRIIRDADVSPRRTRRPESAGIDALLRGVQLTVPDDHEKLRLSAPLYDALYAYCEAKVRTHPPKAGAPRPHLRYGQRVVAHLEEQE